MIEEPEYVWKQTFQACDRWSSYIPRTVVVDSATQLSSVILGHAAIRDPASKVIIKPGTGIMATDRSRIGIFPSLEDYRELSYTMTNFFNGMRMLNEQYNTVVICHAEVHEVEEDSKRTLADKGKSPSRRLGLPILPGRLRWHADNMCDFYLYCDVEQFGKVKKWYAYTGATGFWHARTKIDKHIEHAIEDPTFDKIYVAYEAAFKE